MTPGVPRHGLEALPAPVLSEVVTAVVLETRAIRGALHRLCRLGRCDLRVRAHGRQLVVAGECHCATLLLDMLVEADRFLVRAVGVVLDNPPGAVRAHVRLRITDWTRKRRIEMGTQARTDRIRSGAVARALPDERHRALLEHLVEEAGSIAPLGDERSLHRRLAELAAAEFGGTVDENVAAVLAGLPVVEAACRAARRVPVSGGSGELVTWWERYIERPLGRRRRLDDIALDSIGIDGIDIDGGHVEPDPAADVAAAVLDIAARLPSAPPAQVLVEAIEELVRRHLVPAVVARDFLDDPARVRAAVTQVDRLLAA